MTSCSSRDSDYDREPGGDWKSVSRPPHTLPFLPDTGESSWLQGADKHPTLLVGKQLLWVQVVVSAGFSDEAVPRLQACLWSEVR